MDTKKKSLSEKTDEELKARFIELVSKMETLTDRSALIAHSNAILAVEEEMRNRQVKAGK